MSSVSIRNVHKAFGAVKVIQGIDIDIRDGEFVVMVGPSGCGKSTLLRMVAGLETITSGEIAIGERVVNDLEPKDRDIAMVFQNYALYPHMSVRQNMAYGLKIRRMPAADIEDRVKRAAEILELGPYLDRRPRDLSGGQRQRVAMGRAIVREPAVFLFDELLSNLDAKLRVLMRAELQALHKRLGTTSLYVTHDQVEAMTLAQRMLVMNSGRAEQIGAPLEVYAKPATTFVAGFIGSPPMNLVRGRMSDDGALLQVDADNSVNLPGSPAELRGREIFVGLRPEHLQPCADGDAAFFINVTLVEPLGADTLIHGKLGTQLIVARLAAGATMEGRLGFRFAADQAHWFDAATAHRIETA